MQMNGQCMPYFQLPYLLLRVILASFLAQGHKYYICQVDTYGVAVLKTPVGRSTMQSAFVVGDEGQRQCPINLIRIKGDPGI